VALCANIVKDIKGVAELRPKTRSVFQKALEETLDAFRKGSRVPVHTQLEILDALGQLGAAVKSQLIDATKASLFQVRCRAIDMLLPYLSDDDLFSLDHIFYDGSREPIKTYLISLIDRNRNRAEGIIDGISLNEKTANAISLLPTYLISSSDPLSRKLLHIRATYGYDWYFADTRRFALETLTENWPDDITRNLLVDRIIHDSYFSVKDIALHILSKKWSIECARKLILEHIINEKNEYYRREALSYIVNKWPDENTRKFLEEVAVIDKDRNTRQKALELLVDKWLDEKTYKLIYECASVIGFAASMKGAKFSQIGAVVFTKYCNGKPPYLDPTMPISLTHTKKAVEKTNISVVNIDELVSSLSAHMGWDITKGSAKKT